MKQIIRERNIVDTDIYTYTELFRWNISLSLDSYVTNWKILGRLSELLGLLRWC